MKKQLPIWAAVVAIIVVVGIVASIGTVAMREKQPDASRFPKPSPEVMDMIKRSQESYEKNRGK